MYYHNNQKMKFSLLCVREKRAVAIKNLLQLQSKSAQSL